MRCVCDQSLPLDSTYEAAPGTQRLPNTGSLCGVGGSCQRAGRRRAHLGVDVHVDQERLVGLDRVLQRALKSSDLVMVSASTPLALAQPAKSGL